MTTTTEDDSCTKRCENCGGVLIHAGEPALSAAMLAKALWKTGRFHDSALPEKFEDLDEEQQRWLTQSAETVLRALADQRPDAIQYAEPAHKAGTYDPVASKQFREAQEALAAVRVYAHRVTEVFAIEGNKINPNDPRLHDPDPRCEECVDIMGEPQTMTPVRRQVHEKLLTGWHFPDCPTTLGKSWHDTKGEES